MYGLAVIVIMSLSGHLSNIDEMTDWTNGSVDVFRFEFRTAFCRKLVKFVFYCLFCCIQRLKRWRKVILFGKFDEVGTTLKILSDSVIRHFCTVNILKVVFMNLLKLFVATKVIVYKYCSELFQYCNAQPTRTHLISGLKSWVLSFLSFEIQLAPSEIPANLHGLSGQICLHWAWPTLKGLAEFQNKKV